MTRAAASSRARRAAHAAVGPLTLLFALGCGETGSRVPLPDPVPHAVLLPPTQRLAVGNVGTLVVAARTPAGHRVLPLSVPPIEGVEILGVHTEVREQQGGQWLHRTLVQLRPLRPGAIDWPASTLDVEAPDGQRSTLALPAQRFEVESVLGRQRPDQAPYGLRRPPGIGLGDGFLPGVLIGAGGIGLTALLVGRRRRRQGAAPHAVRPPAPSVSFRSGAAERARTGLEAARTLAHEDPRAASNAGAALLRAFASARFRCELQALTTDEIASRPPGALAPDCIADLVGLLGRYDAERFRKDALAPGGADVRDNLLASIRFIDRWAEGERRR